MYLDISRCYNNKRNTVLMKTQARSQTTLVTAGKTNALDN